MQRLLIILGCILQFSNFHAQSTSLNISSFDSRLLLNYSEKELMEMSDIESEKFQKISYYYLNSYTIENIQIDEQVPFDINQFDISKYEKFRHKTDVIEKLDFKRGVKISLIPIDSMEYKLPIHEPIIPVENED